MYFNISKDNLTIFALFTCYLAFEMYVILSIYFSLCATYFASMTDVAPVTTDVDEIGKPLFLTPLIDAGNSSEARNLSRVGPPLDQFVSYAGYFTVNRTARAHLHFWFIPRTVNDSQRVPLILNLRESYGVFAALADNGPFRMTDQGSPQARDYAWTSNYHMLYLDTIIGIGYSFSEGGGFVGSHFDVGEYTHEALQQFYKVFPEFRQNDLFIAGDAGTFIPAVGHEIHTANQEASAIKIPLKGIIIGNGISDQEKTKILYATYLRSIGLIDKHEQLELEEILKEMASAIRARNWTQAADWDAKLNARLPGMIGEVSGYDYTRDMSHVVDLVQTLTNFVTRNDVRKCMHVGSIKLHSNASEAGEALRKNFGRPVRSLIEELLRERYRVLFYHGQFDLSSSHLMTSNFLRSLHWPGAHEYDTAKTQIWNDTEEKSVAGYYTTAGNLTFVMVRNAGHLVSADQPEYALILIDKFTTESSWLKRA